MAAKPVVFVIGASGSIGSATVSALAAKYADKVEIRAGVRNPDKAPESIKVPGVTIVQAVMGEKEKLTEIFKGVDALFIVTPGAKNRAALTIETAEAAKEAGVKFLLAVSIPTAICPDKSTFGKQFHEIEEGIPKLGVPCCILRLPAFFENMWSYKGTVVSQSVIYGFVSPSKTIAAVAAEDAGKAAAVILTDYEKHNGKTYDLASDCYSNADVSAAFTEALGREVKYVKMTPEAGKQAMGRGMALAEWQITGFMGLMKLIEDEAPVLAKADLNVFKSLTGEEPTSMKAWVTKNAPAFK